MESLSLSFPISLALIAGNRVLSFSRSQSTTTAQSARMGESKNKAPASTDSGLSQRFLTGDAIGPNEPQLH